MAAVITVPRSTQAPTQSPFSPSNRELMCLLSTYIEAKENAEDTAIHGPHTGSEAALRTAHQTPIHHQCTVPMINPPNPDSLSGSKVVVAGTRPATRPAHREKKTVHSAGPGTDSAEAKEAKITM